MFTAGPQNKVLGGIGCFYSGLCGTVQSVVDLRSNTYEATDNPHIVQSIFSNGQPAAPFIDALKNYSSQINNAKTPYQALGISGSNSNAATFSAAELFTGERPVPQRYAPGSENQIPTKPKERLNMRIRYVTWPLIIALTATVLFAVFVGVPLEIQPLAPEKITRIEVYVENGMTLRKVVTKSAEITELVAFVNDHRAGWEKPLLEAPIPRVKLLFFSGDKRDLLFGAGPDFFWSPPYLRSASKQDCLRFAKALGLDGSILLP